MSDRAVSVAVARVDESPEAQDVLDLHKHDLDPVLSLDRAASSIAPRVKLNATVRFPGEGTNSRQWDNVASYSNRAFFTRRAQELHRQRHRIS